MANPFEAYQRELRQSDRDPSTINRYVQMLDSYRQWLGDRQPDTTTAKEFLAYLRDRGYAPASVRLYYHALKQFLKFLGQPLKLKLRRVETLPPYYDRGDVEALIHQAEIGLYHETKRQRQRNQALILTLAFSGVRKAELLNLVVSDIDFNQRRIRVRQGKGRKDRVIPMAQRLVIPLRQECLNKSAKCRKV